MKAFCGINCSVFKVRTKVLNIFLCVKLIFFIKFANVLSAEVTANIEGNVQHERKQDINTAEIAMTIFFYFSFNKNVYITVLRKDIQ